MGISRSRRGPARTRDAGFAGRVVRTPRALRPTSRVHPLGLRSTKKRHRKVRVSGWSRMARTSRGPPVGRTYLRRVSSTQ